MKALEALNILSDLCSSQRGLFTTAQAFAAGVNRMTISRLAKHGQIERVAHGVYRSSAAPYTREEDVYAAWLSTDPAKPAWERHIDETGCTASLGTAAWLFGFGELKPEPITFSCAKRKQTSNHRWRYLKRQLKSEDILIVAGIPTTTPARTVLDLIDYGEDLSLISSVLADAMRQDPALDLKSKIDARGERRGFDRGASLYDYIAGSDA